ncbi:uncharacterized protein LOC144173452 [Haemaphysalis longicornis]
MAILITNRLTVITFAVTFFFVAASTVDSSKQDMDQTNSFCGLGQSQQKDILDCLQATYHTEMSKLGGRAGLENRLCDKTNEKTKQDFEKVVKGREKELRQSLEECTRSLQRA